jgi:hypothetical protein
MAKKSPKKSSTIEAERTGRPVRLDLSETDHERLERIAPERGLNEAWFARMAVLERLKADEGRG